MIERLEKFPSLGEAAVRLFYWAATETSSERFLEQALPLLGEAVGSSHLALVRAERGKWRKIATSGPAVPLPDGLLADALDRELAMSRQDWYVGPLAPHSGSGELLAVYQAWDLSPKSGSAMDTAVGLLASGLAAVRQRERDGKRIDRLEAVLEIASQWQQTLEMEQLLEQMAEASTRLLAAERASIFLWDRRTGTLVGRPALGVEGGELRIANTTGIVGQVVHTGEPRRVDADEEQAEIDRRVDKQLGFRTHSLLCVPLRGSTGELLGAFEMINKRVGNFTDEDQEALTELAFHAAIALENTQEHEQLVRVRNQMADQAAEGVQLIGNCPALEGLRSTIRRVADTELAILLLGENGTGKDVVSQQIHYLSRRRNQPFVAVNCAALTETLLESELFGHEKGAFTDARETRAGKFEVASNGTLFLDEIGDMSLGGQAKLLRVLEEKVVTRVGSSTAIPIDTRVIAATNQKLAELVRMKKFREDLYYRLNVVSLELPPLRERGEDILLLAEHFLRDFCLKARRKPLKLTAPAKKRLVGHSWPGNVRELRNLMERLAYLSANDKVDAEDLNFILAPGEPAPAHVSLELPLTEATRQFQSEYIRKHVQRAQGNMSDAAQRLGLHRTNLYRKMHQLGMPLDNKET